MLPSLLYNTHTQSAHIHRAGQALCQLSASIQLTPEQTWSRYGVCLELFCSGCYLQITTEHRAGWPLRPTLSAPLSRLNKRPSISTYQCLVWNWTITQHYLTEGVCMCFAKPQKKYLCVYVSLALTFKRNCCMCVSERERRRELVCVCVCA